MMMDAILFYCMHCEPRLVTVYMWVCCDWSVIITVKCDWLLHMWVCCDWCIDGPSRLLRGLPARRWNNSLWYVSKGLSPCLSWTWTWASTWGKMELSALCECIYWYWLTNILQSVYKLIIPSSMQWCNQWRQDATGAVCILTRGTARKPLKTPRGCCCTLFAASTYHSYTPGGCWQR